MIDPRHPSNRVNWSILLTPTEAAAWNDLVNDMRKTTERPALTKSDMIRALVKLTEQPAVRAKLIRELRQK